LGEGSPIIIMHGLFGSSDNWLTFAKKLAEKHKVYLLDLRNHGQSPHDTDHNYSVMLEDLRAFIEEHNLFEPVVVGHSMGGKLAMKFATKYPDLLSKLVVIDISPKYYKPHHQKYLAALHALDLKNLQSRQDADVEMQKHINELGVRQFLLKNLYRDENNEFRWRMNLPVLTEQIDNIGEGLDAGQRFRKPTLFVKGELSDYISEDDEIMAKWIFPHAKIETIAGAGHWVQADKPMELLTVMEDFVNK
ncbi:MAG TPA: alpha/beta fold hydrolase, partial [Cytophagales bacterium]|nr:alpha/beta fold hydrolase [Cytophagales bacterium]